MEDTLENEKKELINLNRLWRNTQELDLKDSTLKKVKKKINRNDRIVILFMGLCILFNQGFNGFLQIS